MIVCFYYFHRCLICALSKAQGEKMLYRHFSISLTYHIYLGSFSIKPLMKFLSTTQTVLFQELLFMFPCLKLTVLF